MTEETREERRARYQRMIDRGMTKADIARKDGVSRQWVGDTLGTGEPKSKRSDKHIYVDDAKFKATQKIAAKFGLKLKAGETAGLGSVPLLIEAIADGALILSRPGKGTAPKESVTV